MAVLTTILLALAVLLLALLPYVGPRSGPSPTGEARQDGGFEGLLK